MASLCTLKLLIFTVEMYTYYEFKQF